MVNLKSDQCTASLQYISDELKDYLRDLSLSKWWEDVAFIGNTSSIYDTKLGFMVDFDAFLFASDINSEMGNELAALKMHFESLCGDRDVDFELRIIDGPYKPAMAKLVRPIFVAHLGVFTRERYLACSQLERWAWRKYVCERMPDRLKSLAPPLPTQREFLEGPRGLRDSLAKITAGQVFMVEWVLPDFTERIIAVDRGHVNFVECCFANAANAARNHARSIGAIEADCLSNAEFFAWYDQLVFHSGALLELMKIKAKCRDTGFDVDTTKVWELAMAYMGELERLLSDRALGEIDGKALMSP